MTANLAVRDRVKELRRVPAGELIANPKNWRKHPEPQKKAMRSVLQEIGYAGALLAREDENGKLLLIDGHLRADTTPDMVVPVLVLDVTEAEADKILATLDPISGLAEIDSEAWSKLIGGITFDVPEFGQFLMEIDPRVPDFQPVSVDEQGRLDQKKPTTCPECGHVWTT